MALTEVFLVGYIVRHWRGEVAPWLAFLVSLIAYALVSLGGVWITSLFTGAVVSGIMLVLWCAVGTWAFVGTLRSALAALRQWRTRKAQAVGAVVAVAGLAAFMVFAVLDFYQL